MIRCRVPATAATSHTPSHAASTLALAGDILPGERDALSIVDGVDVIIDHVSASWSIDEVLSTTKGSNRVTVQWTTICCPTMCFRMRS